MMEMMTAEMAAMRLTAVSQFVWSFDQPVGSCDQPVGSCDQPVGSCDQPVGPCDQPVGSCDQPVGSCISLWGHVISLWGHVISLWGHVITNHLDLTTLIEPPHISTHTVGRCTAEQYVCITGGCVNQTQVCDGQQDCQDGSDEFRCCKHRY